jgi:rhomboid family protein
MIPLADDTRHPRSFPIATYGLIGLNFFIFLFFELPLGAPFIEQWALVPNNIIHGQALPTLFTAMFLHIGWAHILGNLLYLWIFGPNLEDVMGRIPYTIFYLLCGLAASAAQIAIDPTSTLPNLGASGAIAGVLGGFILEFPHDEIRMLGWSIKRRGWGHLQASALIGFWFVVQFFSGIGEVASHSVGGGGVAFFAHLGGFAAGFLLVKLFIRGRPAIIPPGPALTETVPSTAGAQAGPGQIPTTSLGWTIEAGLPVSAALSVPPSQMPAPTNPPASPEPSTPGGAQPPSDQRVILWLVGGVVVLLFVCFIVLLGLGLTGLYSGNSPLPLGALPPATLTAQAAQATGAAQQQWPIYLSDTFSNNANHWPTGNQDDVLRSGSVSMTDGAYRLELTAKNGFIQREHPLMSPVGDFYLAVTAQGDSRVPDAPYGLYFRGDADNAYVFQIDDNQVFDLSVHSQGGWHTLIPPTDNLAIHPGQENRLAVEAEGAHLVLFVNDQYVGETADSTLKSGDAGIAVGLNRAGETAIFQFRNFELRTSPEAVATRTAEAQAASASTAIAQADFATMTAVVDQATSARNATAQAQRALTLQAAGATASAVNAGATASAVVQEQEWTATAAVVNPTMTAAAEQTARANIAAAATSYAAAKTAVVQAARATAAFQATATARAQWPVVVAGSFENNKDLWYVGPFTSQFGSFSLSIANAKYILNIHPSKPVNYWQPANTRTLSNLHLSVDGQRVAGPTGVWYGLGFRGDATTSNQYFLAIADTQNLQLSVNNGGSWTTLINDADVSAIRPGAMNKLSVDAVGSHFTVFVNDQYIGAADDGTLAAGQAGVAMEVDTVDNATVQFSNFELRAP